VPALLMQLCESEPPPLDKLCPEASPELSAVVSIAMAKQPEQRYAGACDFARDLRSAAEGKLAARVLERAERIVRGRPAAVIASAAAFDETLADDDLSTGG
jgi:hypothetical protein